MSRVTTLQLPYKIKHWQEFILAVCLEIDGQSVFADFILAIGYHCLITDICLTISGHGGVCD